MSYGLSGTSPLADFTTPLKSTLKTHLTDTWDDYCTDPARGDGVTFGHEWTNGVSPPYAVYVLQISEIPTGNQDNSWHLVEYSQLLGIHIFALRTDNEEPVQLMKMMQGITQNLHVNKLSIVNQVRFFKPSWEPAHDPTNVANSEDSTSYWHHVGRVEARYWRVSV